MHEEKPYQLYDYDFVDPFQFAGGPQTGNIYILAHLKGDNKTLYLLVFKSGVESIRTLTKALVVDSNFNGQYNQIKFAVGGSDVDYIYISYGDVTKYFRAPGEQNVIILPETQESEKYVNTVDFNVVIKPW